MAFDPDAYLGASSQPPSFDPDAYLSGQQKAAPAASEAKPPAMFLSQDASGRMVAAPQANYNQPEQPSYGSRTRAGITAPYQEPLGISKENLEKYPFLKLYEPQAKVLDAISRVPAAAIGALSGYAGDIYQGLGGSSAWADRLQGDINAGAQAAAPEMPMEGAVLQPRLAAREAEGLRPRPPAPPPIPTEPKPGMAQPPLPDVPRQTTRPNAGVDLLPPDTPHELPPERRALSAQGAGGPLSDISPETVEHMRKVMEEQGFTPHTIDQRLEEMSSHQFFGEISDSLENEMGAVASSPGNAQNEIIRSLRERGREAVDRTKNVFNRAFGPQVNLAQEQRIADIERARAADPLYQQFRNTVITPSEQIDALMPRLQAAGVLQSANRKLAIAGEPASRGFIDFTAAPPEVHPVPTAGAFQYAKEALDDKIGAAIKAGEKGDARLYVGLQNELLSALDNHPQVGDLWRRARQAYMAPTEIKNAQDFGKQILTGKVDREELPFLTAAYSDAQNVGMRQGMRSYLENVLGKKDSLTAEALNTVLSPNNIEKIQWAIGNDKANELVNAMQSERVMHTAPTRIYQGSPSARRIEAQKRWNPQPKEGVNLTVHEMLHPTKTAIKKGIQYGVERVGASSRAADEAAMAKLRDESARIMTLQGPERDAVARFLVGGPQGAALPPPMRAEGGRANYHRARYNFIKKQGGGELSDEDQAAMMPETYVNPAVKSLFESDVASKIPQTPSRFSILNAIRGTIRGAESAPQNVVNTAKDLVTLPQRTIEATEAARRGEDYDPGPAMEAASLPIVPGMGIGVRAGAGEEVLAAGAGRKRPPKPPIPVETEDAPAVNQRAVAGSNQPPPEEQRGLSFPPEQSADRLRLKMQRDQKIAAGATPPGEPANPRTVIKAPEGSDLPDFVTGKITPQDWVSRQESMLTPEEIQKSSKWYDEIYDNFLQQTHGDEQKARQYMRGWLVAQQNVDVSGAMRNTLLQREQVLRGVPEEQMIGSGMPNPTLAARRVMQERPIEQGVGQKIADFVDSAEGTDTRAWMGHHPNGGAPFVVDVHTARDTGMVDQELKNHLKRLGYDQNAVDKLKPDLGTSPTATQYENRGDFGRKLTDYLNKQNWQGRSDWTPKEVQAVGWMGMTKLTANKADDVVTGLGSQMRHLSMEVAPGEGSPWAAKYGDRFSALQPADQNAITHQMTQDAIQRASQMAGIDVRDIVHGTGGWQNFQNPSTVAQTFASPQGADIAANALGHMLQQTEVWSNKVKAPTSSPKGFAVDILGSGNHRLGTDEGLRELWGKIMNADPTGKLFQGYQPIVGRDGRVGIRALIDRGGVKTRADLENALSGSVDKVLKSLPGNYESRLGEAEITKHRNDWTQDADGNAYTQRLVHLLGRDPTADLNRHGQELEAKFRKAIEDAEARAAGAKAKARGGVASYARGGRVAYRWPLATAPPPIRAWYQ